MVFWKLLGMYCLCVAVMACCDIRAEERSEFWGPSRKLEKVLRSLILVWLAVEFTWATYLNIKSVGQ